MGEAAGSFLMVAPPSGSLELRLRLDDVKAVLITAGTVSPTGTLLPLSRLVVTTLGSALLLSRLVVMTLGSALPFFLGVPLLGETELVTAASLAWAEEGSFFCFTRSWCLATFEEASADLASLEAAFAAVDSLQIPRELNYIIRG